MSHTMKLWERIIDNRIRRETTISENQFGFMPGRSTMEAIFLVRRLLEKYREKKKDLHMVFVDLEKAYDRVPRDVLWWVLERKRVHARYIDTIKDMYDGVVTSIKTFGGATKEFPITIGLHQGSALSPYLFTLVIDELTRHIQEDIPCCMLFADDIVLVDETKDGVNRKLELWRNTLESKGFKLSRTKTEYMHCEFRNTRHRDDGVVKLGEIEVPKVNHFRYLGSIIQNDGNIENDVTHRIQAGWRKWRSATGVICDRNVPTKLKGKFYRTAIRPAMLYGSECWAVKQQQLHKMNVAEMRMLRWMCGKTREDRIRNIEIQRQVGVAPIDTKIREGRLRWFGHLQRRPTNAPTRKLDSIETVEIRRGKGRPKLTWDALIRRDLNGLESSPSIALNRTQWKSLIHVADPS
ncbi:hypothetical protein Scep_016661 [Stephania cephalantha]|uniref:Reverse transcriptase domain-containing protein n=1 Tax=Stephania cephalantha TaxID=152367 RepID=A0AAP0NTH1_9MAGN